MSATKPAFEHVIHRPSAWPDDLRTVERDGRILAVVRRTEIAHGKGEEWRQMWVRSSEGWVRGGDQRYPDAERAAEAALASGITS